MAEEREDRQREGDGADDDGKGQAAGHEEQGLLVQAPVQAEAVVRQQLPDAG